LKNLYIKIHNTIKKVIRQFAHSVSRMGINFVRKPGRSKANILFLSGLDDSSTRYRCVNQAEQLRREGFSCDISKVQSVDLNSVLEQYFIFVLHRVIYDPTIGQFIEAARAKGKTIVYDVDDLIFDLEIAHSFASFKHKTEKEKSDFVGFLFQNRQTLLAADAVTVSTQSLRSEAQKVHGRVYASFNVAGQELLDISRSAMNGKKRGKSEEVVIGYLCGTPAHYINFMECSNALLWALTSYPNVKFRLIGHLNLGGKFDAYKERVEMLPFQPWQHLPEMLTEIDINLAPLEKGNRFTDCKSGIKYIEAGLVGVPTIASRRTDYVRVIEDGKNGLLVDNEAEWHEALRQLIEFPEYRRQMGANARMDVWKNHTTQSHSKVLGKIMEDILK